MSSTALPVSAELASVSESSPWFVEFLAALIRQAPRPGEALHQAAAEYWLKNQAELKERLKTLLDKLPLPLDFLFKIPVPALPQGHLKVADLREKLEEYGIECTLNFEKRFLVYDGIYENPLEPWDMYAYCLTTRMQDNEILCRFGAWAPSVPLASFLMVLGMHARKEREVFIGNRYNLFYIFDTKHQLNTVRVSEARNGRNRPSYLLLDAFPATGLYRWSPGERVFSRGSVIASLNENVA